MANRATGRVERIYTHEDVYIRLNVAANLRPKDGYFRLRPQHNNYNLLYSLALVAAVNGYALQIRTEQEITSAAYATVLYMVVDW
jgi:hypothetical protein